MSKYNTLGDRIKYIRQKNGLSQNELAKQLNCTQAALSQYERGIREPGITDLVSIANTLSISTDYLLGCTDIMSSDVNLKSIGDYLGLDENSIKQLHNMYKKYKDKTDEQHILEELNYYCNTDIKNEEYYKYYSFLKKDSFRGLSDYKKALNQFISSHAFLMVISKLNNNIFLERSIYDLLRFADNRYDEIETYFIEENPVEQAYSLAECGEDNIRRYSLNLFEIQNAVMDFSQHFTSIEDIKKYEQSDSFYRKVLFAIYSTTSDMIEKGECSLEKMNEHLLRIRAEIDKQLSSLFES